MEKMPVSTDSDIFEELADQLELDADVEFCPMTVKLNAAAIAVVDKRRRPTKTKKGRRRTESYGETASRLLVLLDSLLTKLDEQKGRKRGTPAKS